MKKFALSLIAALAVVAVAGGVATAQGSGVESSTSQAAVTTGNIWA